MTRRIRLIGIVASIIVVIILIWQNTQPVTVRFLVFSRTLPNAVLTTITLLIGIVIGILLAISRRRR